MEQVWFCLKLFEAIMNITALTYHIHGFLNVQSGIKQDYFSCFVFFLGCVFPLIGAINICTDSQPPILIETILNFIATVLNMLASIASMYHAEKSFYLIYLSEFETPIHPYFYYSKSQSVASLVGGIVFLLHTVFLFDVICNKDNEDAESEDVESGESDGEDKTPKALKLYIGGKVVHTFLERFKLFRMISKKKPTT